MKPTHNAIAIMTLFESNDAGYPSYMETLAVFDYDNDMSWYWSKATTENRWDKGPELLAKQMMESFYSYWAPRWQFVTRPLPAALRVLRKGQNPGSLISRARDKTMKQRAEARGR